MIQRSSPLCSSSSLFSHSLLETRRFSAPFGTGASRTGSASTSVRFPSCHLHSLRLALPSPSRVATQETVETSETQLGFVEIGYISNIHGIQGEIRVKPSTGFPELRLSKPGTRWLKQRVLGREAVQEVELVDGRGGHSGQKSWILKFRGIDTAEQAQQLVGSTLLVKEGDRPELQEGEFYSRDLVGMRVILKETSEYVGTVVNVFDSGGNDLLQVRLDVSQDIPNTSGSSSSADTEIFGRLVWIPFVEAIVPDVDLNRREMQITPPSGLLELNLRTDERSKKERRQLEWKERKKFQKRLIAAKKKLCEIEQEHVFHGFRYGEKYQGRLLAEEIVGVNSKLLQQALQDIVMPSKRWTVTELLDATKSKLIRNTLKLSEECLTSNASKVNHGDNFHLQEKGLCLSSSGKTAAIVLVGSDCGYDPNAVGLESTENPTSSALKALFSGDQRFAKVEDRSSMPLILISPASRIHSIEKLFADNDHFAFDSNKVWFLEEEKLPVISNSMEDQKKYKILMKSPWEILQSPIGSGGVINLLSSNDILNELSEIGVEYIEICSSNQMYVGMNSVLLGLLSSSEADIGIQFSKETKDSDENFDVLLSMSFIKGFVAKQSANLPFYAIPKSNSHVKKVEKEWVDVTPSSPNSYQLCSSIYSLLNACPLDKVCVLEIAE